MANGTSHEWDYDFIVIGGGSGGMAAAKEAAAHGARTVLFDYVKPSTQGTKWGLGGTCVNVGCVPKKLMHYAALLGEAMGEDAKNLGWQLPEEPENKWTHLVRTVQMHIRKLNFSYRSGLRSAKVEYVNALAAFESQNSVSFQDPTTRETKVITAPNILIAVGGRPIVPIDIPGARELAITSDDLFSLGRDPKKTLVVGASYIGLECAGLLNGLGRDTTLAVRSILLRGFDRQCSEKVGSVMAEMGVKFLYQCTVKAMKKEGDQIRVEFNGHPSDVFDTVIYAIGRSADTSGLQLEKAGLEALPSGKLEAKGEATGVEGIYAVGDVLEGRPELTPVAIRAGELLARRLFAGAKKQMNYDLVPTTVFSPTEYGSCGLSEEEAIERFGPSDVEVFLSEFTTLEYAAVHRTKVEAKRENEFDTDRQANCLAKLVCRKSEDLKVVGFHFVGPNAGEMTQGFGLALQLGAKKADFDDIVGIHPTDAEVFTSLGITKASGISWVAAGGCGGGKCG